jgi:hypothetical protein
MQKKGAREKKKRKKKLPQIYKIKKTLWLFALLLLDTMNVHLLITGSTHLIKCLRVP